MEALKFEYDYHKTVGFESPPLNEPCIFERVVGQCHDAEVDFYDALLLILQIDYLRQIDPEKHTDHIAMSNVHPGKFRADSEAYYNPLQNYLTYSTLGTGYEKDRFDLLIREMAAHNLFIYSIKSPEVIRFFEARFDRSKEHWLMLQDELGDRAIHLEKIRLRNANINFKWMELFGKEYIPMVEQEDRLDILTRKKALIEMYPDISSSELDDKLKEHIMEKDKRLKAMEMEVTFASRGEIFPDECLQIGYEHAKQYLQASKKILREIVLLIHPDMLRQNPNYNMLTDDQKELLDNIWHEVMALKEDEIGYAKGCQGYEFRSVVILSDKLDLARSILDNAGLDADPRHVIQGDTLYEKLGWLERSVRSLEIAINSLQAEQKVLFEDNEVREREIMIKWPESRKDELKNIYSRQKKNMNRKPMNWRNT